MIFLIEQSTLTLKKFVQLTQHLFYNDDYTINNESFKALLSLLCYWHNDHSSDAAEDKAKSPNAED